MRVPTALRAILLGSVVGLALSTATPARADKACEADCEESTAECERVCREHAGEGAGRCLQACKEVEAECFKECNEPDTSDE
ncbi:MAG: hypothetical protein D6729_04490 [Deltaproteobacteria bacterium]|nr:MAG: hypothetical protein D6729_04490 [Deltaproteobacteria bacterium]